MSIKSINIMIIESPARPSVGLTDLPSVSRLSNSRWSSSCGRRSDDQFVLVSGSPLGPMTRFFFSFDNYFVALPRAPSPMRGRVCNLQCNRCLVRLLWTNNHSLQSHLRLCLDNVGSSTSHNPIGLRSLLRYNFTLWKRNVLPVRYELECKCCYK
jgi:hypothetical protein